MLRNIRNIRICMGKKPIVSLTYENERISIKNSLKMCVTSLLCDPWAHIWPLYGLYCKRFSLYRANRFQHLLNGHKSARKPHRKEETHNLSKVSRFLFKSFDIRKQQKIVFLPYKPLYFERYATV